MNQRLKIKTLFLPSSILLLFLLTGCAHQHSDLHHNKLMAEHKHMVWQWPADGRIIRTFDSDKGKNKGIDIAGKTGADVYAVASGKVVYCGSSLYSYGELIIVKHEGNFVSVYSHVRHSRIKEKDFVKAGQKIAKIARNKQGKSILHFEIRKTGTPVNPLLYIPTKI